MSEQDPRRLLDPRSDIAAGLRAVLEADRDALPDAARLEALARRLGPEFLGPGVEPPVPPPATSASAGVPPAIAGAAALAALLAATAFVWWTSLGRPAPETSPGLPTPDAPGPELPRATHAGAAATRAADAGPSDPPDATAEHRKPSRPPSRTAGRRDRATTRSDPVAELTLLDEAQRALHTVPGAALAHTERHRAQFPDGQYAQEREVIAIEALLLLEHRDSARRRAARFLRRFPGSGHGPRVRELLQKASATANEP